MTLVVKSEKTIIDKKKTMSRESSTPFWKPKKCVMTLREATVLTSHGLAACDRKSITGGKPHRMRNKQMTTEMMKLTTWLRVIAEVKQLMARYAPAMSQLPMKAAKTTPLSG